MPFTFSHPALVLPLYARFKKKLSLTGLIAGSIAPDFEYFLRIYHESFYSHTWLGLFWFDVPAGVLIGFLYHNFIRQPFVAHAPAFVRQRLSPYNTFNWNQWCKQNWLKVLACVFIGAASHFAWDKLTHHCVYMVQEVSGFKTYATTNDRAMTYFLFWDIASLLGGFIVAYSFWLLPKANCVQASKTTRAYWLCLGSSTGILFALEYKRENLAVLDNFVIAAINSLLLGAVLTSFVFVRISKRKQTMQTRAA